MMVWTSLKLGTLLNKFPPSLRREETKMGRVEFFEPLTSTSPINLSPPRIRILSILRSSLESERYKVEWLEPSSTFSL
jgi:hypothetical protein